MKLSPVKSLSVGGGTIGSITTVGYGVYDKLIKDDSILKRDSDPSDWRKAAYRYLTALTSNTVSEDWKLEGVDPLKEYGFSEQISRFERACLALLDSNTNKRKLNKWCTKFTSISDKLLLEDKALVVDLDRWNGKYESFISVGGDLKVLLESMKNRKAPWDRDDDKNAQRTAIFWCSNFLSNEEYSIESYRKFQNSCIVEAV